MLRYTKPVKWTRKQSLMIEKITQPNYDLIMTSFENRFQASISSYAKTEEHKLIFPEKIAT